MWHVLWFHIDAMSGVRSALLFLLLLTSLALSGCREEGDIQISSLEFEGVEQVDKSALANALQTRRGSRIVWGRKRYFDRAAFEADLQRIRAFYRDRGFPDARVASFDVRLNDAQDKVDITLRISEGQPIVVTEVVLSGLDVIPPDDVGTLSETLPLQPERPLDRQLAVTARERVLNALRDHGYPYAQVVLTEEEEGPYRRRVRLDATPGALAYFGGVEIVGAASVSDNVIRRLIRFDTGDVFTRQQMRETQRALYGLELFEFVNVESLEDANRQPTDVPVRVTVAEGKHQKVSFGIGYGSEERVRARIQWDHNNFLGDARHLGVEAKWSSLDRGVRTNYNEPFFLTRHLSLGLEGQVWQAREPVYDLDVVGGRLTLLHQADSLNLWSIGLINEFQRSEITNEALLDLSIRDDLIALGLDPRVGETSGTLSGVVFDISRNTTGSLLDSRTGYVLNGHLEQAGRWLGGSFSYWSASGEGRYFKTVARRFVVANRLRIGTIEAMGKRSDISTGELEPVTANPIPFYKRYFLGGSASIRGWGRFEVGPTSGFGLPLGGHTMFEGSSELRVPVTDRIGAVAFIDYGNVWTGSWQIDLRDLRYAVGPGLRYLTPVGPIRVDFGYQLTPIDGLRVNGELEPRHWRLHFSIGQAF